MCSRGLNFIYGLQGKGFCPLGREHGKAALSVGLFLILGVFGVLRKGSRLKSLFKVGLFVILGFSGVPGKGSRLKSLFF